MRKKTIAILFIVGIILAVIGGVLTGAAASGNNSGLASAGLGLYGIGGIIYAISWIGALVATAKQSRWVWFILTFLFSPLVELIYLIVGPSL